MSKKKNTLRDLDEFLKQQAATLVTPTPLSEKIETSPSNQQNTTIAEVPSETITEEQLINNLKAFAQQQGSAFRKNLYNLIIKSLEAQHQSLPEDKMLINTLLYLKSGHNWKETIQDYWRNAKG